MKKNSQKKNELRLSESIGERLREKRRAKKNKRGRRMSQADMAELMNISINMYSNYERGVNNIPYEKLVEISKILETTPNYFLGFEEKNTN